MPLQAQPRGGHGKCRSVAHEEGPRGHEDSCLVERFFHRHDHRREALGRAKKDLERAETQVKVGVKKIFSDGCLDDVEYCKQVLLDNPSWVPFLLKLPREGTFADIATIEANENAKKERVAKWGGSKIGGRIKCLNNAKPSLRHAFLAEVNPLIVHNAEDELCKQPTTTQLTAARISTLCRPRQSAASRECTSALPYGCTGDWVVASIACSQGGERGRNISEPGTGGRTTSRSSRPWRRTGLRFRGVTMWSGRSTTCTTPTRLCALIRWKVARCLSTIMCGATCLHLMPSRRVRTS